MPRIDPVDRATAPAKTQQLLDQVERTLGTVPNIIATMAQSPALTAAYLGFSEALSQGSVRPTLREQIALAVSQNNQCDYCLAAHSAIGSSLGLSEDQVRDARTATSPDRKIEIALQFARRVAEQRGFVANADLDAMRTAGYSEAAIVEIVGYVALTVFTNYFNHVAETEVDFPTAAELVVS
jgi:uncharacterized peroxidase-related enzyme